MADPYQITIIRKNNQTLTSISNAPLGDVYAMLYSAVKCVSDRTHQPVKYTLNCLVELDNFINESGEGST